MPDAEKSSSRFALRSQLTEGRIMEVPAIERPDLDPMPTNVAETRADEMASGVDESASGRAGGDTSSLPDMGPADEYPDGASASDREDQQPRPPERLAAAEGSEGGYVRLRIHVEDGEATVMSVSQVDGPLVTADAAGGGYVWEVVVDGERVTSDVFGDMSTWRSFPDVHASPEDERSGHHITELTAFDFTARVPINRLRFDALERAEVNVFQVKDANRPLPFLASRRPLAQEYPKELRQVARVPALDERHVGDGVVGRLRSILPDR